MDLDLSTHRSHGVSNNLLLSAYVLGHFLVLASIDLSARGDRARLSVSNTSTQSSHLHVPALHRVSALNLARNVHINRCTVLVRCRNALTWCSLQKAATGVMKPCETLPRRAATEATTTPQHQHRCLTRAPRRHLGTWAPQAYRSRRPQIKRSIELENA